MSSEPLESELSWADSFLKDLLTESEKYQDVIRGLPDDIIGGITSKLDTASEEYRTGIEILTNRAVDNTSLVLIEVDEETDEEASKASNETDKANKEADSETTEQVFITNRYTSHILIEVNADINKVIDEIREGNESILSSVSGWLTGGFDSLFDSLIPLAEVIVAGIASLLTIPLEALFVKVRDFFFEEVKE